MKAESEASKIDINQPERAEVNVVKKSIFFDKRWYKKQYPDTVAADSALHFVRYGWREGRNPGPLFSVQLYLEANPDVKAADRNPLVHYERNGKKEKRTLGYVPSAYKLLKKSRLFNEKWYLKQYPQVAETGVSPIIHYLIKGWKQGYNPSRYFNTQSYLTQNDDVRNAQVCPLVHYLKNGKKEGRAITGVQLIQGKTRGFFNKLRRSFYRRAYNRHIKKNSKVKIAVHIHLYYVDLWDEIKSYLRNLSCYSYDLFITHTDPIPPRILNNIQKFKRDARIIKLENRGFDLGPFIYFLHQINLNDYQIIYKLHTKRNVKAANYYGVYMKGPEWRRFLFDGILDERNVHEVVDSLATPHNGIGMVACDKLVTSVDSTYNKEETMRVMARYKLPVPSEYKCVMGTMFAAKADVFHNIKKAVAFEDFTQTKRDVFSLAHAFERILCLNVIAQGLDIKGLRAPYWLSPLRAWQAKRHPYQSVFLPDTTLMRSVTFFRKNNRVWNRFVTVSSIVSELNPGLYTSLLKLGTIDPEHDEPVDKTTFTHLVLMGNLFRERKIAEIVSPSEITTFRMVGNQITVEKKTKVNRFARLSPCDAAPSFLLQGTYLQDKLRELLESDQTSIYQFVKLLLPCVKSACKTFATLHPNILSPFAWDAIPRNVIIDNHGNYRFFDCNIKYVEGVRKYYYIYRITLDLLLLSQQQQRKLSLAQIKEIYELLCFESKVTPNYDKAEKLEKKLVVSLQHKYSKKTAFFESFRTILSYAKWGWHVSLRSVYHHKKDVTPIDPYLILKKSKYFDKKYYLANNPDVKRSNADPVSHFLEFGWKERRNPSPHFDIDFYLSKYPDILAAKCNPLIHFITKGKAEGRFPKLSKKICNAKQYDAIAQSPYFDAKWYSQQYQLKPHIDPVAHYLVIGAFLGYIPSPAFDGNKYWQAYPDIHRARMNPLWHWELAGKNEEARLMFSQADGPMQIYYPDGYQHIDSARNILLVTHMLNHTGAPILLRDTAQMLRNRGYNVYILSPMDGDLTQECLDIDVPVIIAQDCKLYDKTIQLPVKFDLYLCNTFLTWPSVYNAMMNNIPYIWWIHDNLSEPMVFGQLEKTLMLSKDVYVPSEITKSCVAPFTRNVKKLSYLIHDYAESPAPRQKGSGDKIIVSVLGTISRRKAQDVYVDAIALLPEETRQKAEFHFIGYTSDDEFGLDVCKKIERIPEAVIKPVLLSTQEYHDYVDSVDIVCCPSREDPFPLVVIDGFMHAKACVISNRVGQAELIYNGKNGYVTPVEDTQALAETLRELIEDEDKLIAVQRESRMIYDRRFNYTKSADIICNILEGKCKKSLS